jgi:hypothetical protein
MTPEESHAEIAKTGHRWIDISVAACALIVSVTSLFVAVRHGHSMERMAESNARLVQANSWPLLQRYQSDVGRGGAPVFSLDIVNNGVGPAKVESLEVAWKGQPVRNPRQLLALCCGQDPDGSSGIESSGLMGYVLRAGEIREIVEFAEDAPHEGLLKQLKLTISLKDISWRACYCSVFDECWVSDLQTLHPQSVAQCPVPKVPFRS